MGADMSGPMTRAERSEYQAVKIRSGLSQLRVIFFLCGLLYGLFAFLDHLLISQYLDVFLLIRFAIVIPVTLAYLLWTFHPSFIRLAGLLTFILIVTGGVGIAIMLVLYPDNFSYYGGLFLVIFTGYFLAKQNTGPAAASGALTVLLYLLIHVIIHGALRPQALLAMAFYTGANVIGTYGNHQLEQIGRSHFMQKREIERQNELLASRVRAQQTEINQIEKAVDSTNDGVAICNPEGVVTYRNRAYDRLMQPLFNTNGDCAVRNIGNTGVAGHEPDIGDAAAREPASVDTAASRYPFEDILVHVQNGLTWEGERTLAAPGQQDVVLLVQADAVRDEEGRITGIVTTCRDITERKDAEEKMRFLSFHDTLTGLFNRTWFDEELRRLDRTRQLPLSLIMADLNGLKLINDTYGHAVGDRFLQQSANLLRQACRGEDIIARWGGDEFVVLLPQTTYLQATHMTERIAAACSLSNFEGIPISVALGVACKETADEPVADLLQQAEDRMYKQKLTESRSHKSAVLNALRSTLQEKSYETDTHAGNMQEAAHYIGEQLGLSHDDMSRLDLVIRLHDIGKINMPGELLRKNGPLTPEEWEVMRQHPEIGYRIARATDDVAHVAEEILSHHERWDGSGYPRGLKGTDISLLARITTLVDAYEVMRNGRPYKPPMTLDAIRSEIQACAGRHFDPELVGVFLSWPGWGQAL